MTADINSNSYSDVIVALKELVVRFENSGHGWLLGGSSGLWLQGVSLGAPPRDIDIYADMEDVEQLHDQLTEIMLDEPRLDKSGLYISRLSHYRLGNLTMELVGGFEVNTLDASYVTEVSSVLLEEAVLYQLEGVIVPLMPLSHELVFNVLRERPDRYFAIAEVMRSSLEQHLPLLMKIFIRNGWNTVMVDRLAVMLDSPELMEQWLDHRNSKS
ncbi:hypothetical protein [Paenibacillus segetis]|uniref:Nucleotidyl transferase AbiEii toxin, Type IV TA system n=1 Tax=Paenibacillus segetis TaxID=1325360 RepID=A0ABQ1YHP1_9BACL|nr:hypothetical protein [Paenibacillus segetis]GGH24587.1 hypothetical protein GCM10008013_24410 [Paenibacillus segetis]